MAEEDKNKGTPAVDDKVDKGDTGDKTKVNIGEDGKPLKPGDEGYLYAGKYKSVEEFEKGYSESEKKITELGQAKGERDRAVTELVSKASEARKATGEEDEAKALERRKVLATKLKTAWEKDPMEALGFLEELIESKQTGVMTRADYDKKLASDDADTKEYNRVRGTGDKEKESQQKEFDGLKPVMNEIWNKLPKEARVSSMIETVFLAAKAKAAPNLREKVIADIKGGIGQPGGGPSPTDKRTEDDKIIDDIVKQREKDRVKLSD